MKVLEIAFTAYSVTDIARSRNFYETVLNLTPNSVVGTAEHAWVEYEIGPHTLAITNMNPEWKPGPGGGGAALEVEDFEKTVAWLKEKGVAFYHEPMESPVCNLCLISDPDGNSICIHKRKPHQHG